jgi:hypothetical protein
MLEFMGSRFNWRVGQFDHLNKKKKKTLLLEFSKVQNHREKMYLRGALDSAQFFIT